MLLVTDLVNVRYLTGFTGSNGLALIGPDTRVFVTDFRYVEQAAAGGRPAFERATVRRRTCSRDRRARCPTGELRLGFEAEPT